MSVAAVGFGWFGGAAAVVEAVELFVAPAGDGAALVVEAWTSVSGELSLVLAGGAAGEVSRVLPGNPRLEPSGECPPQRICRAGVGEPVCAFGKGDGTEQCRRPADKVFEVIKHSVNGKLKNAEAFKAGSRPARISGRAILELVETASGLEDNGRIALELCEVKCSQRACPAVRPGLSRRRGRRCPGAGVSPAKGRSGDSRTWRAP